MEIVLHAVVAAPKTKGFAEVKERFYFLCELGGYQLIGKMRAVEKWLSHYGYPVSYRHNAQARL